MIHNFRLNFQFRLDLHPSSHHSQHLNLQSMVIQVVCLTCSWPNYYTNTLQTLAIWVWTTHAYERMIIQPRLGLIRFRSGFGVDQQGGLVGHWKGRGRLPPSLFEIPR